MISVCLHCIFITSFLPCEKWNALYVKMIVSTLGEQRYAAPGLANVNNLKGRESPRRWRVSLTAAGLWNSWAPWVLHLLLHPVCQEAPSIQIDLINIGEKKNLPKCRSEFSFFFVPRVLLHSRTLTPQADKKKSWHTSQCLSALPLYYSGNVSVMATLLALQICIFFCGS